MKKIICLLAICSSMHLFAQTAVDDTSSVDKIVNAMYNVISGPAGQRDWKRFKNLFSSDCKLGAIFKTKQNTLVYKSFTPDDYIKSNDPYFLENAFTEKELHRVVNTFGQLVQVFTTYEFESGGEKQRGINALQLVYANNRWWIASLIWQEETDDNPLPAEYLPK